MCSADDNKTYMDVCATTIESKKWMISLVKQGNIKVGLHSPSGWTRLLTPKTIFLFIKWGSLAMSAGANPVIFRPI
jgi:hypothetical protein